MLLTKDTLDFLNDLVANNNREWFQANKSRYEPVWQGMKSFVSALIKGLADFDPQIHEQIDAGKCQFRIYRDTRFSDDKTPYKTWLGAGISKNGRKLAGPEYYIHIQPGNQSFIAVGYWRPEKEHLDAIRQEIDYNGEELTKILKAMREQNSAIELGEYDKLKRPPQGYSVDHPQLEIIKLKSFTLHYDLSDKVVRSPKLLEEVLAIYEVMLPFKNFIHQALGDK